MDTLKDITDFRDQNGSASLFESLAANIRPFDPSAKKTEPAEPKWPEIVNARDLLTKRPEKPPELIKGLLHQGSKMVLGGGSKSYKTWSLLDLGMSVATGQPWWGFETTKGKVLYINLELADWSISERIEEIKTHRPELLGMNQFDVWNLRGFSVSFDQMRPKIVEKIAQGYGLIIIDPIYKVYGNRDENSAGDMGELLNEIERLAVSSGAAVVFGAHFSKGNQAGKESIDRISGSGVFARDPDSILVMTKHETEDTYTVEATLRNFKPVPPFCVRREHPLMVVDENADPKNLKRANVKTEKFSPELLMNALGHYDLTTTEWQERTCKATGMSKRTFMDKFATLKSDPLKLKQLASGKWRAAWLVAPTSDDTNAAAVENEKPEPEVQTCN